MRDAGLDMGEDYDYLIVGAGILGLATAHRLQRENPGATVAVVDKEASVAAHQSGHNSGVIHAGVYYPPGSLKAQYCSAGLRATIAFCARFDIKHRQCGKLIVATEAAELGRLSNLGERARANGLRCDELDADAVSALEPNIVGLGALHIADTGIADYPAICETLARLISAAGGVVMLNSRVEAIVEAANEVRIETNKGAFTARYLVVCGGLQADRLARLAGLDTDFAIVPFRGDYYRLPRERSGLISTLIYPVPDPRLPFLGVHLTLTTDGFITVGPTAMLAFARESYRKWAVNLRDLTAALSFGGTWRLLARFPRAGLAECLHAIDRRRYLQAAQRYCPALVLEDLSHHECGVRAQAVSRGGDMIYDFLIKHTPRSAHVCNAPSPAATAAFPIADAIVARIPV